MVQNVVSTRLLVSTIDCYGKSITWTSLLIATDSSTQGYRSRKLVASVVLTHGRQGQRRWIVRWQDRGRRT